MKLKQPDIKPIHKTLIAFALSLFCFLSAFLVFSKSYHLSNYADELKSYGIDYNKFFNLSEILASSVYPIDGHINLSENPKKIIIKIPSGDIVLYNTSSSDLEFYGSATVSKTFDNFTNFDFNYLEKTNTQILSVLDNIPSKDLFRSNVEINIPASYKGEVVIQTKTGKILDYTEGSHFKLTTEQLK